VILADEPTGNLDPETAEMILDFLQSLHREGRTMLMVTHDPRASGYAHKSLRLAEGRISSNGAQPKIHLCSSTDARIKEQI